MLSTMTPSLQDAHSDSAFCFLRDVLGRGLLPVGMPIRNRYASIDGGVLRKHICVVLAIEEAVITWPVRRRDGRVG